MKIQNSDMIELYDLSKSKPKTLTELSNSETKILFFALNNLHKGKSEIELKDVSEEQFQNLKIKLASSNQLILQKKNENKTFEAIKKTLSVLFGLRKSESSLNNVIGSNEKQIQKLKSTKNMIDNFKKGVDADEINKPIQEEMVKFYANYNGMVSTLNQKIAELRKKITETPQAKPLCEKFIKELSTLRDLSMKPEATQKEKCHDLKKIWEEQLKKIENRKKNMESQVKYYEEGIKIYGKELE